MRFSLNRAQYDSLHKLVFTSNYPGFKPDVVESPHGDNKWDNTKKYAHVATKYFDKSTPAFLRIMYDKCFVEAQRVFTSLKCPDQFAPDYGQCCLRILDYPPGAGSETHTDFDFMTAPLRAYVSTGRRSVSCLLTTKMSRYGTIEEREWT